MSLLGWGVWGKTYPKGQHLNFGVTMLMMSDHEAEGPEMVTLKKDTKLAFKTD